MNGDPRCSVYRGTRRRSTAVLEAALGENCLLEARPFPRSWRLGSMHTPWHGVRPGDQAGDVATSSKNSSSRRNTAPCNEAHTQREKASDISFPVARNSSEVEKHQFAVAGIEL